MKDNGLMGIGFSIIFVMIGIYLVSLYLEKDNLAYLIIGILSIVFFGGMVLFRLFKKK